MIQIFDKAIYENVWVCADLHFSHKNSLNFSTMRHEFSNGDITVFDDKLVEVLNSTIGEDGILLCLGDIALRKQSMIDNSSRLVIKDRYLIRGNHDTCGEATYKKAGWKILPMLEVEKILFTHYPVHPNELGGFNSGEGWGRYVGNCHGHIHQNKIDDKRYYNVSLEAINMVPVKLSQIIEYYQGLQNGKY